MKRGTKIEIRSCTNHTAIGKIIKQHKNDPRDTFKASEWFIVKTTDKYGEWTGSVHRSMIREI